MSRIKIYSFAVKEKVEKQLSRDLIQAMKMSGWSAFAVYELVAKELRKERKAQKLKPDA